MTDEQQAAQVEGLMESSSAMKASTGSLNNAVMLIKRDLGNFEFEQGFLTRIDQAIAGITNLSAELTQAIMGKRRK